MFSSIGFFADGMTGRCKRRACGASGEAGGGPGRSGGGPGGSGCGSDEVDYDPGLAGGYPGVGMVVLAWWSRRWPLWLL